MPTKWFKMPDGSRLEVEEVLEKGLLIDRYPTPYLRECVDRRRWRGRCSTTQCLRGTRLAYLEILVDYEVDPDDQAFRIVGNRGHSRLEQNISVQELAEQRFTEGEISGIADHLEPDPAAPGFYILDDYKVSGSYKIVLALGLTKKKRQATDKNGQPAVYKRAGKWGKIGDPRMEDYSVVDPSKRDMGDWGLQLNQYRIRAEAELKIEDQPVKISRMRIFIPVRDGGLEVARRRGVEYKTYSFWIEKMADEEVTAYFEKKRVALVGAMDGYQMSIDAGHEQDQAMLDNMPAACGKDEAWNGRRCQGYCPVAEVCARVGNPYVSPAEEVGSEQR